VLGCRAPNGVLALRPRHPAPAAKDAGRAADRTVGPAGFRWRAAGIRGVDSEDLNVRVGRAAEPYPRAPLHPHPHHIDEGQAHPMQRTEQVRRNPTATYIGIALCVVGFALIAIAWNGAAELDYIQGQFPFFISGGLTGIGLIVVGVTIMVIETLRRDAEIRAIEIGRLTASLAVLNSELSPPDEFDPRVAGEFRPRPRVSPLALTAAAANGNGNGTRAVDGDDQTIELATPRDGSWDAGS
jgi:uncharacterized membrane protein YidH (DUF202 family)